VDAILSGSKSLLEIPIMASLKRPINPRKNDIVYSKTKTEFIINIVFVADYLCNWGQMIQ
jgi:hypothetical protein